jgi:carbamate kinase
MAETLVIALGGNAITRPGEPGTIPQQFQHTAETLEHLMPLFRGDSNLAIVHGNGPQIGNILIRVEEGSGGCRAFRWTPASPIRRAAWAT